MLPNIPPALIDRLSESRHVVVLTGSGVSAESGVPTFRDAQSGMWEKFKAEDLATPEAFARNPGLVWKWYAWRRDLVREVEPNPGHHAIARLEKTLPKVTLVTQNVDGLHQRAGSGRVLEFHGNITRSKCFVENVPVDERQLAGAGADTPPACPYCGGWIRPDVVWFGETIPEDVLEGAFRAAADCDVFLSAGTSSLVYPAAGLAEAAMSADATIVEINPNPTPLSERADFVLRGPSGAVFPALAVALASGD